MGAADRNEVRNPRAPEDAPVFGKDTILVANCQGDHHCAVTACTERLAHARTHDMPGAGDECVGAGGRPILKQDGLAAHLANRAHVAREHPAFVVERSRVRGAVRAPQYQRGAPNLAGQDLGQLLPGSGKARICRCAPLHGRRPVHENALGHAGNRARDHMRLEAPRAIAIRAQARDAKRHPGDFVLKRRIEPVGETRLRKPCGVGRSRKGASRDNADGCERNRQMPRLARRICQQHEGHREQCNSKADRHADGRQITACMRERGPGDPAQRSQTSHGAPEKPGILRSGALARQPGCTQASRA